MAPFGAETQRASGGQRHLGCFPFWPLSTGPHHLHLRAQGHLAVWGEGPREEPRACDPRPLLPLPGPISPPSTSLPGLSAAPVPSAALRAHSAHSPSPSDRLPRLWVRFCSSGLRTSLSRRLSALPATLCPRPQRSPGPAPASTCPFPARRRLLCTAPRASLMRFAWRVSQTPF